MDIIGTRGNFGKVKPGAVFEGWFGQSELLHFQEACCRATEETPPVGSGHQHIGFSLKSSRQEGRFMSNMKTVYTTGEAARICKVSQQTIIRCFDSGQLKGFRVPGSKFRRIPRDILYKFMKENGIPTDALESGKRKALVVDDDEELVDLIRDHLESDGRFEVRVASNGFDAGMMVKEYHPDVVVLDVMLPDINGKEVCQRIRSDASLSDVRIVCISGMVEEDKIADLLSSGANEFLQKPFEVEQLVDLMCKQLDVEPIEAR
jgi:excisionase family DNA binding protein